MLVKVLVGFVALEHVYFMLLEMVFWNRPLGLKTFRNTQEFANASLTLARNQGLYNGFLAAGLVWGLLAGAEQALSVQTFFLGCVAVAGAFGAATVSVRILFLQALPAVIALAVVWASR